MLQDIILTQQRELEAKQKERYLERTVKKGPLTSALIKVIIGPRRAGKSFFGMRNIIALGKYGYANFDDERLVNIEDYDEIIAAIQAVYDHPKHLLLDEIQNLKGWELFANRLQRQGYDLYLTGSNAHLLGKELATHLTGRHATIILFPFSFKEVVKEKGMKLTQPELKQALESYLLSGGFPEIIMKKAEGKDYLSTLMDSIIYKDIVKRYQVRNAMEIENLCTFLLTNIAKEHSALSLTKVTGIKSSHSIEKYLRYLEETFFFFSIPLFSFKVKEQKKRQKRYCIDNGLVQAKGFLTSPDKGKLYENLVAISLKRKELNKEMTAYYYKTSSQDEVDFVIKKGLQISQLVQVCYDLSHPKTRDREIRALITAADELKCKNLLIITAEKEGMETHAWFGKKATIRFMPLYKWLLEE